MVSTFKMIVEWIAANSFAVKSLFLSALFFALAVAYVAMAVSLWTGGAPPLGPVSWGGCALLWAVASFLFFHMFVDALRGR